MSEKKKLKFRLELQQLINQNSLENGSDTPDFILAEYLADCLETFDRIVNVRETWYGRPRRRPGSLPAPRPGVDSAHAALSGSASKPELPSQRSPS